MEPVWSLIGVVTFYPCLHPRVMFVLASCCDVSFHFWWHQSRFQSSEIHNHCITFECFVKHSLTNISTYPGQVSRKTNRQYVEYNMCIYISICKCIDAHRSVYIYICVCVCVRMHLYIYIYIYIYRYRHIFVSAVYMHIYIYIYIFFIYLNIYLSIYLSIYLVMF